MARQVVLEQRCQQQFEELYDSQHFTYGLIIGQPSMAGPEYVIYLAQTKVTVDEANESPAPRHTDTTIHVAELVEHSLNALRMLPGSFFILGLFVVSPKLPDEGNAEYKAQIKALQTLSKALQDNVWIFGSTDKFEKGDRLLLNYAGEKAIRCNTVSLDELKPVLAAATVKFEDKPIVWAQLRTKIDEPFCFRITRTPDGNVSVNDNVLETLRILYIRLSHSQIFVENDPKTKDGSAGIDVLFKLNKRPDADMEASLFFNVEDPFDEKYLKIDRWSGFIKCMGEISSHVFIHPKLTLQDVNRFVQTDIMRSVSGRLRLYLDAYNGLSNEQKVLKIYQIQPPRRAYFKVFDDSNIQFSEYLFTGENYEQVVLNAQDVFGLRIPKEKVTETVEKMRYPAEQIHDEMRKQPTDKVRLFLKASDWCCWSIIMLAFAAVIFAIIIQVWFNYESDLEEMRSQY